MLGAWSKNFAAVFAEHVGRGAVNVGGDQIGDTAGEKGDAVTLGVAGGFVLGDERVGKGWVDFWGGRFEFANAAREQSRELKATDERLQTENLVKPEQTTGGPHDARMHEQ